METCDAPGGGGPEVPPPSSEALDALARAGSHPELLEALDGFASWWQRHVGVQETELFPALLESMAGSDAVCIREWVERAVLEHRAIDALRTRAVHAASSDVGAITEVSELFEACRRHLSVEAAELMPMSARLLGEAEAAAFARALR